MQPEMQICIQSLIHSVKVLSGEWCYVTEHYILQFKVQCFHQHMQINEVQSDQLYYININLPNTLLSNMILCIDLIKRIFTMEYWQHQNWQFFYTWRQIIINGQTRSQPWYSARLMTFGSCSTCIKYCMHSGRQNEVSLLYKPSSFCFKMVNVSISIPLFFTLSDHWSLVKRGRVDPLEK